MPRNRSLISLTLIPTHLTGSRQLRIQMLQPRLGALAQYRAYARTLRSAFAHLRKRKRRPSRIPYSTCSILHACSLGDIILSVGHISRRHSYTFLATHTALLCDSLRVTKLGRFVTGFIVRRHCGLLDKWYVDMVAPYRASPLLSVCVATVV